VTVSLAVLKDSLVDSPGDLQSGEDQSLAKGMVVEPERPTLQCGASEAQWVVFLQGWEQYTQYYDFDTDQDTVATS
jgi:hypothetical protein